MLIQVYYINYLRKIYETNPKAFTKKMGRDEFKTIFIKLLNNAELFRDDSSFFIY